MFSAYFGDYEPKVHSGKITNDDIKQFNGIYEAMITTTKKSKLKEAYSRTIGVL